MKKSVFTMLRLCIAAFFTIALTGCGESNTIPDPVGGGSAAKCDDLPAGSCVSGRFVADFVQNLNYSCGEGASKVVDVTGVDGSFRCPKDSTVTFSIENPSGGVLPLDKRKITLGSIKVLPAPSLGVSLANTFFYVTPATLTGNASGDSARNITRLLQTIRRADTHGLDDAARAVVLLDLDKEKLTNDVLTSGDITPDDFANTATFEAKVATWLTAIGKPTLISAADADAVLKKSLYGTVSGIYFVPGYATTLGRDASCENNNSYFLGFCGFNASKYFLGTLWGMVDRAGRVVGAGIYSEGNKASPSSAVSASDWDRCKSLLPLTDTTCRNIQPARLPMSIQSPLTSPWPIWNDNGDWNYSLNLLDANTNSVGRNLVFSAGNLARDIIVGADAYYKNAFGGVDRGSASLGLWRMGSDYLSLSDTTSPRYSFVRARPISPTLDRSFWCVTGDTDCRRPVSFPINVVLSFYSAINPVTGTLCTGSTDPNCRLGQDLRISILRDGNIVSNLNNACGVYADAANLIKAGGGQDYPLGVVAQAFERNTWSYASIMLMVPLFTNVPEFASLRGLNIGTTMLNNLSYLTMAAPVRMRIDQSAVPSERYAMYAENAVSTSAGSSTLVGAETDLSGSASWSNPYQFLLDGKESNAGGGLFVINNAVSQRSGGIQVSSDPACP